MRKTLLFLTVAASLLLPHAAHADSGLSTYGHPYIHNPALNPKTNWPMHACKHADPFSAQRSCYWDARIQGNGRGKSYDVYLHWSNVSGSRVLTRVCVAYWDTRYSLTHNWCQHAVSLTTANLETGVATTTML